MRILIVTDKFPPNIVGGAEISLHATLRHISHSDPNIELHVAVLDQPPQSAPVQETSTEGLVVTRLAGLGQWPPHYPYPAAGAAPRGGLRGRLAWPISALRYLLTPNGRGLPARWSRLSAFRALTKSGQIHAMPSFDDDLVAASRTRKQLRKLVEQVAPDMIHADNTRSILVANSLRKVTAPIAALVRDNRFLCSRRDQDTHINGTACSTCAFACIDSSDTLASRQRAIMQDINAYRRKRLANSKHVITTSHFLSNQLSAMLPGHDIAIAPNSHAAHQTAPHQTRKIGVASPPEVLIVGMLNANKGQARVIHWIKALLDKVPDVRFVLAGRGQLSVALQREAEQAGLADHLILAGFLDQPALQRAYQRATLVLIPTVWPEPFGRVPLEAGLAGKAVIAYAVGGLTESIVNGETGYLVAPADETQLVDRMAELILDQSKAESFGKAGERLITAQYGPDKSASALVSAWRKTLELAE